MATFTDTDTATRDWDSDENNDTDLLLLQLIFVRHGESTANRDGILQGQADYPLTDVGKQQASVVGNRLKDIEFTKIYSSDLMRAAETADIIVTENNKIAEKNDNNNKSNIIIRDESLREYLLGCRQNLPVKTNVKEAIAICAKKEGIPLSEYVPLPSENRKDMYNRTSLFLEGIVSDVWQEEAKEDFENEILNNSSSFKKQEEVEENNNNIEKRKKKKKRFLIVSHGGCIFSMIQEVLGFTELRMVQNCSISCISICHKKKKNKFKNISDTNHLIRDRKVNIRLDCVNDIKHLKDEEIVTFTKI